MQMNRLQRLIDETSELEVISGKRQDRAHSVDNTPADLIGKINEVLDALRNPTAPPATDVNPNVGSGIEARIAHLEACTAHLQRDFTQMRTDVREIRDRLSHIQERVRHLPSNGLLAVSGLTVAIAIAAASAFEQQLQAFVAAALLI
jgi:uncharacterized coiled-coil protein SlyX